jgi:hypothetical protein
LDTLPPRTPAPIGEGREREYSNWRKWEKARIGEVAAMQTGGGESVFSLSITQLQDDLEQTAVFVHCISLEVF